MEISLFIAMIPIYFGYIFLFTWPLFLMAFVLVHFAVKELKQRVQKYRLKKAKEAKITWIDIYGQPQFLLL